MALGTEPTHPAITPPGWTARTLVTRRFTRTGENVYDTVEWSRRTARLESAGDGRAVFVRPGVEFPVGWSDTAVSITAEKYFHRGDGAGPAEWSLRELIDRIAGTIARWGLHDGYFADEDESEAFRDELTDILLRQRAAFNSPVWFNIGVPSVPQRSSACFILAVEDSLDGILQWYAEESKVFRSGSGAGVNLSRIRSSRELMKTGETASGPLAFMRAADALAGAIKSGGRTRGSAKMVILDAQHPDVWEFINSKVVDERRARTLAASGLAPPSEAVAGAGLAYENTNHSVRVSDEFMESVLADRSWALRAVRTGEALDVVSARRLLRAIAEAAWECGDPGVQFDDVINGWNTCAGSGRLTACNPCGEFHQLDNSACNLSSLNLGAFVADGQLDVSGFVHTANIMLVAQDILVDRSDYPTPAIAHTAQTFRHVGLGITNLGGTLMSLGAAYDSPTARRFAAACVGLLTATAYRTSAALADRLGAFAAYPVNAPYVLDVLERHRTAMATLGEAESGHGLERCTDEIVACANENWSAALDDARQFGVRNAHTTLIAPAGTISFVLDAATTGIEPEFALVKTKALVGGGEIRTVNTSVEQGLRSLGYDGPVVEAALAHVARTGGMHGAPDVDPDDLPVFACAVGDAALSPRAHLEMVAAVQPLISGAVSKTINCPGDATVDDVFDVFVDAWKLGVKTVTVYRDQSKLGQPLQRATQPGPSEHVPTTCPTCGATLRRTGSCWTCSECGLVTACS